MENAELGLSAALYQYLSSCTCFKELYLLDWQY
jgi:hypothetical protein